MLTPSSLILVFQCFSFQRLSKSVFYRRYGKRLFDLLVAGILIPLLFPIILVAWSFVRLKLGSPVLFRQKRPGRGGRVFSIFKFRTMTDDRSASGELLPDADRLTAFGHFLRSSSLDELPGLLNVLRGDMSLVGPRPLLVEYLDRYSAEQSRRHEVRPGITGWAQVNGRNAISWDDKFTCDVWYVDHECFSLDVKILLMTVAKVFTRSDISAEGESTMEVFGGSGAPPKS